MAFTGKYILAAIDGTGSHEWRQANGSNSHTFKFFRDFDPAGGGKAYWNGPGEEFGGEVAGTGSGAIINGAVAFVEQSLSTIIGTGVTKFFKRNVMFGIRERAEFLKEFEKTVRICLVGHSRGGLIAINVANRLPVPVHFLGLYDAVDMHTVLDGDTITNARTTYHAMRDPTIGSRSSWGNCGRSSTGIYFEKFFRTSHGGIGGDPVLRPSGMTADYSCSIETTSANIEAFLGSSRETYCINQSLAADMWIRDGAKKEGFRL